MKQKLFYIFILIFTLAFFIFPTISFANYTNYLALGDSIAYGYTIENGILEEQSYPQQFRKKIDISYSNYKNLSIPGETAKSFYSTIQTEEYTNAIANADLITISIGSNEILQIIFEAFSEVTGIELTDDSDSIKTIYDYIKNANIVTKFQFLLNSFNFFTTVDIDEQVDTNIMTYETYWKKSLNYIKEINPNVTIVATEFYNPYYGITFLNYDFGGWVDNIIQRLNNILHISSKSESEYYIAKIYSDFNTTNPRLTYVSPSFLSFNIDPHPNVLGHEIISLRVLEALSLIKNAPKQTDISSLAINTIEDQHYTGKAIEPKIVIKNGNSTLVKDKDYITCYYNNVELGEASVSIIGIGNYTGVQTLKFNIKGSADKKDIANCKIDSLNPQIYLGMPLEPTVTIHDGNMVLVENKDYKLSYSNNLNAGIAQIVINGIGNYSGFTKTTFIIVPNTITLATVQDIPNQLYTGDKLTPDVIVTYLASRLVENKDYTIQYQDNIEVGTATITITGKGNFTGTLTKNFDIINDVTSQSKDISEATAGKIPAKVYSGKSITPLVEITFKNKKLVQNKDYKTYYSNNLNVGTGSITVMGIGEYTGTLDINFEILPKNIENMYAIFLPLQSYSGNAIEPEVLMVDYPNFLQLNTDYKLKYKNNIDVGTATIEITGIGNYTGTLTKMFSIVKINNSQDTNQNNNNSVQYPALPGDNSTSPEILPNTGISLKFIIVILSFSFIAVISYRLYKKW